MSGEENEDGEQIEASEAEDIASSLCWTVVGTKGLSSAAKLISWCKPMDLVGIVNQENQISMHRLNWQKIWSATETRDITALAWKSDGKSIITGFSDGHYTLWDIENGTITFSTLKHGTTSHLARAPVCYVSWHCPSEPQHPKVVLRSQRYADSGLIKLAPLWALQGVDAPPGGLFSSSTMENDQLALGKQYTIVDSSTTRLERSEPSKLNILSVSHSDGVCCLYALGTFEVGRIDVMSLISEIITGIDVGSAGILASHFSADISHLYLIAQLRAKDDSVKFDDQGGEIGPDGKTLMLVMDTSILRQKAQEILAVMWQSTLIQDLYYRIAALTEKMALLWSDAITPFVTKMKMFNDQLAGESSHEAAFLDLLACGTKSSTLETLLVVNYGAKTAENLLRTFEAACDSLEHLVNQHLRPTAERLMFRLITLNSYRLHSRAFSSLGLSETLISEMMGDVRKMISHCANFVLHLSRSRILYVNFLKWLWINSIEEAADRPDLQVDPHLVGQFLKGDTRGNPIGDLIIGKGTPISGTTSNLKPVLAMADRFPLPAQQQTQRDASPPTTAAKPSRIPLQALDDSLGLDESLHYSNMSIDPSEDANMSMDFASVASFTPAKSFKPPMTSSPDASNMGPIQFIDLPKSLEILPDDVTMMFAPKQPVFHTAEHLSFSNLRNSVHQHAEQLFASISKNLSTHITLSSHLLLFTRPELLKIEDDLTETYPMKDFIDVMQSEYQFQFVDGATDAAEPGPHIIFKDAQSLWIVRLTNLDSFAVTGVELASLHAEGEVAFEEETVVGIQYYKDQRLMAMLRPLEENRCQVQKLSLESLQYYASKIDVVNSSNGMINFFDDVVMMHPFQHTSEETIEQRRDFSVDALSLCVSGPRGVGLISGAPRKVILLDFENDESPEDNEAEEGEA